MAGDDQGAKAAPKLRSAQRHSAAPAAWDGALGSASLPAHDILALLRNPEITPAVLRKIAGSPVWMRSYKVRSALVQHPKTPRSLAMELVSSLRWGDLAKVAVASRLPIALRHAAERILLIRLPELELGEKVSLARVATPSVIRGLRGENCPLVTRALLQNGSLRFEEVLFMAGRRDAPADLLELLAGSARFARRRELHLALAAHPRTPPAVALRLVAELEPGGLAAIAASDAAPVLVRVAAERRLSPGLGRSVTVTA